MADMAPALTGAAHRLLLLNGGEAGQARPHDAPGPGRGMRRSLRGPREAMGPNSAAKGPPAMLDSATCPSVTAPGPTAPKPAQGPHNKGAQGPGKAKPGPPAMLDSPSCPSVIATGPTAPKPAPGPHKGAQGPSKAKLGPLATQDSPICPSVPAAGPTAPKPASGPHNKRLEGAQGPPARTTATQDNAICPSVSAVGPTTPKPALGPHNKRSEGAQGPPVTQDSATCPSVTAAGPTKPGVGPPGRTTPATQDSVTAPGPLNKGAQGPQIKPSVTSLGLATPSSAQGPPKRTTPGPTAHKHGLGPHNKQLAGASGPQDERCEGALGPATPKHGPGSQGKQYPGAPEPQGKRCVSAPGPTAPTEGSGPWDKRMDTALGPTTPKHVSSPWPTTPNDGSMPQGKQLEGAPGPATTHERRKGGSGAPERCASVPGLNTSKHGPGPQSKPSDGALGPRDKRCVSAPGPTNTQERRRDVVGSMDKRLGSALGPQDKRTYSALGPTTPGPQNKRFEGALGPNTTRERQKDGPGPQERGCLSASGPTTPKDDDSGPQEQRTNLALGPPPRSSPEKPSSQDSATRTSVAAPGPNVTQERRTGGPGAQDKKVGVAPGPIAAKERQNNGLGSQHRNLDVERRKDGLGAQEKCAPGPVVLGNVKGHLAGQALAPEPTGRTEGTLAVTPNPFHAPGPSAAAPNPSHAPGPSAAAPNPSHAPGPSAAAPNPSHAPGPSAAAPNPSHAPGPVSSQDVAPRALCSLRAAQMSSRQQELGSRARRLCRRLQVIQAKQVERHVRQQLSGLVEMLSERGAAGLPGSPHLELDRLACSSTARLRAAQGGFDSDATESSSGGESSEEETAESSAGETEEEERRAETRCDRHAEWRWAVERAAIICRWTWLQAQVSDLEFRIRQQTEIYKQIRSTKGGVVLGDCAQEDSAARHTTTSSLNARANRVPSSSPSCKPPTKAPSGDEPCDQLNTPTPAHISQKQCSRLTPSVENVACQNAPPTPACDPAAPQKPLRQVNGLINCVRSSASCNGSAEDADEVLGKKRRVDPLPASPALCDSTCVAARTRPLRGYKKRSLVRSSDVSSLSRKPQKALCVKCGCDPPSTCILCGCNTYARSSHACNTPLNERLAMMEPYYHPILSFPYDTPIHLHFEALLKDDRQLRASNKLKILKLSQLSRKPHDAARSMFRDDRQYKGGSGPNIQVSSPVTPRSHPASHQLSCSDTPPSSNQNSASAALKRKRFENSYDIDNIVIPMSVVAASRVEKLQYKEILTPSWRVLEAAEKDVLQVDPQLEDVSDDAYQERHSKNEELERSRWDSWTSLTPQRRGSRSSNKCEGRWPPGSGPIQASPYHSLNDMPLSLTSAAATDYSEPYSNVQCLAVRARLLSWSEDTRSSTPEMPDEEQQVVQPWEHRWFPLSDRDCRALTASPDCRALTASPDCLALTASPGTPDPGRTKPHPDLPWQTPPGAWTESLESGTSTENLSPASKEPPSPNSISVVRVRAHSGDKIASLEYFPARPVNKR